MTSEPRLPWAIQLLERRIERLKILIGAERGPAAMRAKRIMEDECEALRVVLAEVTARMVTPARVVLALSHAGDEPVSAERLASLIGTTENVVKVTICRLRDQGYVIECKRGRGARGYILVRSPGE